MTVNFDTLTYSKRLQQAGVPKEQAEAHADAALYLFRAIDPTRVVPQLSGTNLDTPAVKDDLTAMGRRLTFRVGGMVIAATLILALVVVLAKAPPSI